MLRIGSKTRLFAGTPDDKAPRLAPSAHALLKVTCQEAIRNKQPRLLVLDDTAWAIKANGALMCAFEVTHIPEEIDMDAELEPVPWSAAPEFVVHVDRLDDKDRLFVDLEEDVRAECAYVETPEGKVDGRVEDWLPGSFNWPSGIKGVLCVKLTDGRTVKRSL